MMESSGLVDVINPAKGRTYIPPSFYNNLTFSGIIIYSPPGLFQSLFLMRREIMHGTC